MPNRALIQRLTIRGPSAAIVAGGYRTAAALRAFTVRRARSNDSGPFEWTLTAALERADPFHVKAAKGLALVAPRRGGFWYWPLLAPPAIVAGTLTAKLGPPEF
jgi:hypothetical protein